MDCNNCIKDFCPCVSKSIAEYRLEQSNKIRNKMIEWLEKNQINYELTKTKGIVLLTSDNHQAYLSLATRINEKKKVRLKGKGKWYEISSTRIKKEFVKKDERKKFK
jgi:hypothetical protein